MKQELSKHRAKIKKYAEAYNIQIQNREHQAFKSELDL
jgi:hypothetical protein